MMVNMFIKEHIVLVLHCNYAKMVLFGSCIQSDKIFPPVGKHACGNTLSMVCINLSSQIAA